MVGDVLETVAAVEGGLELEGYVEGVEEEVRVGDVGVCTVELVSDD